MARLAISTLGDLGLRRGRRRQGLEWRLRLGLEPCRPMGRRLLRPVLCPRLLGLVRLLDNHLMGGADGIGSYSMIKLHAPLAGFQLHDCYPRAFTIMAEAFSPLASMQVWWCLQLSGVGQKPLT